MEFFRSKSLNPVTEEGEEWFSIHPDIQDYQFSNHFRLKSLKWGKEKIIKFHLNNNGYLKANICINKKRFALRLHQAICLTFNNPYEKFYLSFDEIWKDFCVNHIDGDRSNNHPSNLELVPSIENHCICKNDGRILELEEVIEIYKLSSISYLNSKEIANLYNINNYQVIDHIKYGRSWLYYTHVIENTKPWEIELILKKFNKIENKNFQEAALVNFF